MAQALRLHFSVKMSIATLVVKVDSLGSAEEIGFGVQLDSSTPDIDQLDSSRIVVGVVNWFVCVWSLFSRLGPLMILAGL